MKKFFAVSISVGIIAMMLTVGFSSKASSRGVSDFSLRENADSMGASGLTALRSVVEGAVFKSESPLEGSRTKAVEVVEGRSTSFEGLAVSVNSITEIAGCNTNCLEVRMSLSVNGGEITTLSYKEGEEFSYGGYGIKISQLAPLTPLNGVRRRAVLLFAVE
jgi:hypothetical protein